MTRRVVIAAPSMSLSEAWSLMRQCRFRHLPVVDEGLLLGIVSDRDVLAWATRAESGAMDVPDTTLMKVMTPAPYVCRPDTHVADLVRIMTEQKIDAVPVVDAADRLVGLVTSTDLLLLLISLDEAKVPIPFQFELDSPRIAASA